MHHDASAMGDHPSLASIREWDREGEPTYFALAGLDHGDLEFRARRVSRSLLKPFAKRPNPT